MFASKVVIIKTFTQQAVLYSQTNNLTMENQQNTEHPNGQDSQQGKAENERANYTSLASDGPVSTDEAEGKSNLQNTEPYEDDEDEIEDEDEDLEVGG